MKGLRRLPPNLLPALLWLMSMPSFSCRSCPDPVQVLPPRPPAQITVTPDKTPYNLPPLPTPATMGGVPDGEDKVIVTKSGLADLARYLGGVRAWIEAASICLEVAP